jgi:glucose/arabinose dehydrogenase
MWMRLSLWMSATALLVACGGGSGTDAEAAPAAPATSVPASPPGPLRAVTVASGLVNPWSLAFLPDGGLLVTERPGRLRRVAPNGQLVAAAITGVPAVAATGQGGLFDVVLAADFASSRRLYLSYAEPGTGPEAGRNGLAVGAAVLSVDGSALTQWRVIFRQSPKVASSGHFGGRIVLAPGDTLFITLGDRQAASESVKAQDLAQGHGKIMRIRSDGSVPAGNPFVGQPSAQATIWSYGHRNVQGAALHPQTGELWATEHGPQGGDELNRVRAGLNYGWPRVSYGCDYGSPVGNCTPVGGASTGPGYEPPVSYWVPTSIAPSGLAFYTGGRYPEWRGQLFSGALAGQALWRIQLNGHEVVQREALLTNLGERIRDVRQGPDEWLYVLTDSGNGRVLRLER